MVVIISLFQPVKTDTKKLGAVCSMGEEGWREGHILKIQTLRTVFECKIRSYMASRLCLVQKC